jgi:hypothetical protein
MATLKELLEAKITHDLEHSQSANLLAAAWNLSLRPDKEEIVTKNYLDTDINIIATLSIEQPGLAIDAIVANIMRGKFFRASEITRKILNLQKADPENTFDLVDILGQELYHALLGEIANDPL